MNKETVGFIEIFFASLLFGLIPILVRYGENLGSYNLSFFRVLIASITLYLFFKISNKSKIIPFKYERKKLFFFGVIHGFIILGYFLAIEYLSIASAVLLIYSSSIWIVVFSYFILKEKITQQTLAALLISFIGVIFVISPTSLFIKESFIGSISGLLAGVGMGLVYTLSKTFKKYDKISLTYWQNVIAVPFMLPLLFIDIPNFTFFDSLIVLLLGILGVIAFVLIYRGFEKVDAQKGSIIIMLDIVFSIMFAYILFDEMPKILAIFGGTLIILGSYLITRNQNKIEEVI